MMKFNMIALCYSWMYVGKLMFSEKLRIWYLVSDISFTTESETETRVISPSVSYLSAECAYWGLWNTKMFVEFWSRVTSFSTLHSLKPSAWPSWKQPAVDCRCVGVSCNHSKNLWENVQIRFKLQNKNPPEIRGFISLHLFIRKTVYQWKKIHV